MSTDIIETPALREIFAGTLEYLDPAELVIRHDQVREDLGDLTGLAASMKTVGVLQPLVINEAREVIAGQRRRAASIEAGLAKVPCYVIAGDEEGIFITAAGLVENEHRKDLSLVEIVEGYRQLRLLGVSQKDMAAWTGQSANRVKKLTAVGKSEVATAGAGQWNLTLEQAAQLAEFADDDNAIARLERAHLQGNSGGWDHAVSYLRQEKREAKVRAKLKAELEAEGYTVYATWEEFPESAVRLHKLRSKDDTDERITIEGHATCEGRGALLHDWQADEWIPVCCDAATYHFVPKEPVYERQATQSDRGTDGKLTDEAKAERKAIREGNKAWRAATPVRQDFVAGVVKARSTPKGMLRWCVTELAVMPSGVGDAAHHESSVSVNRHNGDGMDEVAAAVAAVPEAKLGLALFAQISHSYEYRLSGDQNGGVGHWQNPSWNGTHDARYLRYLVELGYTLSEVEAGIITFVDDMAARWAAREAAAQTPEAVAKAMAVAEESRSYATSHQDPEAEEGDHDDADPCGDDDREWDDDQSDLAYEGEEIPD